jgi:hypothetical protein
MKNGIPGKIWRLLCECYGKVENKVICGACESEWFGHDYGVKQGYILYPALFSVLVKYVLDKLANLDVPFSLQIVHALFYADGIRIAKNAQYTCALKWNLKLNSYISKLSVVGNRKYKHN